MKSKILLSLVAAGALANSAQALTIADLPYTLDELLTAPMIQISGATAPDNTFNRAFILDTTVATGEGMFSPSTVIRFEGSADGDDATITCGFPLASVVSNVAKPTEMANVSGGVATLSTTAPACVQKVAHGSDQGTLNVGTSTALNFMDLAQLVDGTGAIIDTNCAAEVDVPVDGAFMNYVLVAGCNNFANKVPDCGVSDVEPRLFDQDPNSLDTASVIDLPWGMQASIPFYHALQAVQYAGTDCDPGEANYDTVAATDFDGDANGISRAANCVPSLKLGDIRSIFVGDQSFATDLLLADGTPLVSAPDLAYGSITVPADDTALDGNLYAGDESVSPIPAVVDGSQRIYLCRRKESSGTQASYEAKFLRERCETGVARMKAGDITGSDNLGGAADGKKVDFLNAGQNTVFENSGSSDVTECIEAATRQNVWAIGINSTEKIAETQTNNERDAYSHIKIDGVLPTSLNVATGYHPFFSSVAGNTRPDEDDAALGTGNPQFCRENVFEASSSATVVSSLLPAFVHGWGQGGALAISGKGVNALPAATYAMGLTEGELALNPVNQYHLAASGELNNCQVPTKLPSAGATTIPTVITPIK